MSQETMKTKNARRNRGDCMRGVLWGGTDRYEGDDGREFKDTDILRMRLNLLEGKGTPEEQAFWQKVITGEQIEFDRLDIIYEAAKK